jgi:hypothetical protein
MKIGIMLILMMSFFSCQATELSGECQTKLRVHKELTGGKENLLILDMAVEFLDEQQILFFLEGSTTLQEKTYTISRYLTFTYSKKADDFYSLKRVSIEKFSSDNYPDENFTEQFGIDAERPLIHISKLKNHYIFANDFSPIFICIAS